MNTFGRTGQVPPPWLPMPEQQHQRGGGAEGTGDPGGNGGGEGGPGAEDPSEGFGGPGGAADSPSRGGPSGPSSDGEGNYGYDPGQQGRQNPGRGYFGSDISVPEQAQLGGRGRDPGWDKPGGYDYGPNGDVVVKVDPVTQMPSFKVYGQAYQDWFDAQIESIENPLARAVAKGLSKTFMGRMMQATGRMFGQEVNYDGSPVGGHAESAFGEGEGAREEEEPDADGDGGTKEEGDPTDAAADAYKQLLARIQGRRGVRDWISPDYAWIYEMSGLAPPQIGPPPQEGAT